MIIDTHAHLNFNAYKEDSSEVIQRSLDNDIWIINVGSQYSTSRRAVEIAERYENGVYAAIGLHPIHLADGISKVRLDKKETALFVENEDFDYLKYIELAESKKVVAVGEIGLDYYYHPKAKAKLAEFKERQKEVFLKQIKLARELNLPIIFHCRFAHNDLLKIFSEKCSRKIRGVMHCFTGDLRQAEKYLAMGFYLGFNGIIFSAQGGSASGGKLDLDEIIKKIPLDKILIETDCPYLTPPPEEGRNEPLYIKYVAERIAKIKGLSFKEISNITTQNAKKLFNI